MTVSLGIAGRALADPWPEFQATPSREGRAASVGPQTPNIVWSTQPLNDSPFTSQLSAGPVLDAEGVAFVGHHAGVTAIDRITHEFLWTFPTGDTIDATPSIWSGRTLFGTAEDLFYCVNTTTGEEIWQRPAAPHPNRGSVVDSDGVVYYPTQEPFFYARRVEDGAEVWTLEHYARFISPPALDLIGQLYTGTMGPSQLVALATSDGSLQWPFQLMNWVQEPSPVRDGRVYVPSRDHNLYCLDAETGEEIWRFDGQHVASGVALRHDGISVHLSDNGLVGRLYGVSPDGEELWRYEFFNQASHSPPIVDAVGNAYFVTNKNQTDGWVHAVDPDGNGLWVKVMPHQVTATPMLAPDGTLYVVCRDKRLYAFRDPPGDLDFDGDIDLDDFASFEECRTAPRIWGEAALTAPGCELLDFDSDWDVDLADLAAFQRAFTGP